MAAGREEISRRVRQLEIERIGLAKETDGGSRERLPRLDADLKRMHDELAALKGHWEKEKASVTRIRELKAQRERLKIDEARAERQGDLETVARLLEGEVQKLGHMEERLHARVVGQDEAVRVVSEAVRRARAGLQDARRPMGSFLFLGPTGVGKTELARALAEFLFDDEHAMIRIDMSEYQEKHTVARLVGAPPGYVGYEEGGQLTEAVRRRPYSVVLFDEIE